MTFYDIFKENYSGIIQTKCLTVIPAYVFSKKSLILVFKLRVLLYLFTCLFYLPMVAVNDGFHES